MILFAPEQIYLHLNSKYNHRNCILFLPGCRKNANLLFPFAKAFYARPFYNKTLTRLKYPKTKPGV